ncbi:unnamed protein product [Pylaiella littoralis]
MEIAGCKNRSGVRRAFHVCVRSIRVTGDTTARVSSVHLYAAHMCVCVVAPSVLTPAYTCGLRERVSRGRTGGRSTQTGVFVFFVRLFSPAVLALILRLHRYRPAPVQAIP